jgi:membrane protein required for beta-lactamase induction
MTQVHQKCGLQRKMGLDMEIRVKRPSLGALLLGLIPFAGLCFSVSLWDRIYPIVLGIPFNLFWLILWIVVTPLCMWGAYRLEVPRRSDRNRDSAS